MLMTVEVQDFFFFFSVFKVEIWFLKTEIATWECSNPQ